MQSRSHVGIERQRVVCLKMAKFLAIACDRGYINGQLVAGLLSSSVSGSGGAKDCAAWSVLGHFPRANLGVPRANRTRNIEALGATPRDAERLIY